MYEEMRNQLALWIRDLSGAEILARADNILTRLVRRQYPGLANALPAIQTGNVVW
jgi:hypothetical protein